MRLIVFVLDLEFLRLSFEFFVNLLARAQHGHLRAPSHPQCKPKSTFNLKIVPAVAPALPLAERELRH
jgi:hypothetical protein